MQNNLDEFQEMLNEIMTPEMLETLQNLKEKMENMNTDQMLQALQNLEFDLSLMEQELDRFIEMFERAMAEQALEKLVQQLSEMIDNQLIITDELNSDIKPENLSSKLSVSISGSTAPILTKTKPPTVIVGFDKKVIGKIYQFNNSDIICSSVSEVLSNLN